MRKKARAEVNIVFGRAMTRLGVGLKQYQFHALAPVLKEAYEVAYRMAKEIDARDS
jgi:hypothetical protein